MTDRWLHWSVMLRKLPKVDCYIVSTLSVVTGASSYAVVTGTHSAVTSTSVGTLSVNAVTNTLTLCVDLGTPSDIIGILAGTHSVDTSTNPAIDLEDSYIEYSKDFWVKICIRVTDVLSLL